MPPNESWLSYDNGTNINAIGILWGDPTFEWGIRLTPPELAPYDGKKILVIRHHHDCEDYVTTPYTTQGEIRIYSQGNTTTSPGELLYSQPYTAYEIDWNDVFLTTPFIIDASKDLWICLTTTHKIGQYPAGYGPGPVIPAKGGWFYHHDIGYWTEFDDLNWNIWAGIQGLEILSVSGWLGVHAQVSTNGNHTLTNITWNIHVSGGLFNKINTTTSSIISLLPPKTFYLIQSNIILGFGLIEVSVSVKANTSILAVDTIQKKGFIIGCLVLV